MDTKDGADHRSVHRQPPLQRLIQPQRLTVSGLRKSRLKVPCISSCWLCGGVQGASQDLWPVHVGHRLITKPWSHQGHCRTTM